MLGGDERGHRDRLVQITLRILLLAVLVGHQGQALRQERVGLGVLLAFGLLRNGLAEQADRVLVALALLGGLRRIDDAGQRLTLLDLACLAQCRRHVGGRFDIALLGVTRRRHADQVLEHRAVGLGLHGVGTQAPALFDRDEFGQHLGQVLDENLLLVGADLLAAVLVFVHHERAQVEGDALHQHRLGNDHRGVGFLRVPHAEFVEHIGVQRGQVGDDDVGLVDPAVHDRIDAAGEVGIDRPKAIDIHLVAGRLHQLLVGLVQVQHAPGRVIGLVAEAGDDKTGQLAVCHRFCMVRRLARR